MVHLDKSKMAFTDGVCMHSRWAHGSRCSDGIGADTAVHSFCDRPTLQRTLLSTWGSVRPRDLPALPLASPTPAHVLHRHISPRLPSLCNLQMWSKRSVCMLLLLLLSCA